MLRLHDEETAEHLICERVAVARSRPSVLLEAIDLFSMSLVTTSERKLGKIKN